MQRATRSLAATLLLSQVLLSRTPSRVLAADQEAASARETVSAAGTSDPLFRSCIETLTSLAAKLSPARSPEDSTAALAEARTRLEAVPAASRSAAITSWLASGADAPTGLQFAVGENGALASAPTLRVWLLDLLDRTDPAACTPVARGILAAHDSADEWAIALRHLARADSSPETRRFLATKTAELLTDAAWQAHPSAGWLEAFDLIVFLQAFELVPQLAALVSHPPHPATAHAAFLTLDRLAQADAAKALTPLLRSDLLTIRPFAGASLFARLDPRLPEHRALAEAYLLRPGADREAVRHFLQTWPSANYIISHNLLTNDRPTSRKQLAEIDAAALAIVETWLSDPRFISLSSELQRTRARIAMFVRQEQEQH